MRIYSEKDASKAVKKIKASKSRYILYVMDEGILFLAPYSEKRFKKQWDYNSLVGVYGPGVLVREMKADIRHALTSDITPVNTDRGKHVLYQEKCGVPYGGLPVHRMAGIMA